MSVSCPPTCLLYRLSVWLPRPRSPRRIRKPLFFLARIGPPSTWYQLICSPKPHLFETNLQSRLKFLPYEFGENDIRVDVALKPIEIFSSGNITLPGSMRIYLFFYVWDSGFRIPESVKCLLVESGILGFGIRQTNLVPRAFPLKNGWGRKRDLFPTNFLREKPWGRGCRNTAQRMRNPTKDWNPESKFHLKNTGIKCLESGIHGVESRIQDCLGLPYMVRYLTEPTRRSLKGSLRIPLRLKVIVLTVLSDSMSSLQHVFQLLHTHRCKVNILMNL